jgi:DNA repair protein RecO (recombination protein O)
VDLRTTGLILRTRPLTETSLIVHWLTPDFGRIATVAKGARRPKSPFRGKLDLFYLCEFTFLRSRRSDLHTLREVSLRETHSALRRELGWLEQASYAAELLEQTTETETPLPEFFDLLAGFLKHLPDHAPRPQTAFAFEMKLLRLLGQSPDLASSKLTAGSRQILEKLGELDWPAASRLKPSVGQIREMQQFLHGFLVYHLGKQPKGRKTAVVSKV